MVLELLEVILEQMPRTRYPAYRHVIAQAPKNVFDFPAGTELVVLSLDHKHRFLH
jgi:hypothetical protein